jgi:hypothetical protein
MYHDVVLWMMKRDLLVVLHLRVRIVATREVKIRVREMRERWLRRRKGGRVSKRVEGVHRDEEEEVNWMGGVYYDFPTNGVYRRPNHSSGSKDAREDMENEADDNEGTDSEDDDEGGREEDGQAGDDEDSGWDTSLEGGDVDIGDLTPCIISDPGRATPLERRWLAAMSVGKDPEIVRRFEL